jgi:hypothetical protein
MSTSHHLYLIKVLIPQGLVKISLFQGSPPKDIKLNQTSLLCDTFISIVTSILKCIFQSAWL